MPSTMIIMPAIKVMVSQLMPVEVVAAPIWYQKFGWKMLYRLSASNTARPLRMHRPNTTVRVRKPHPRVAMCRSTFSVTIRKNMARKITTAETWAINMI